MEWAKVKFFFDTMLGSAGSTLAATSTATGDYAAAYLYNMLETNMWLSADASSLQYITYDAGAGNVMTADYLAVIGHNLKSAGAAVTLQYSDDAFVAHAWDAFAAFIPVTDGALLKEFSGPGAYRYWRFVITGAATAPYMTLAIWGVATELDYATASFDPHGVEIKASMNISYAGCVTGVHTRYAERSLTLVFNDADAELYGRIKQWWDTSGLRNFFVAWESANSPFDVWLMRPEARFSNPLKAGGLYRDVTIQLKGRKE